MTRERAKEIAPIIQAYGEGKAIQSRYIVDEKWSDSPSPGWYDDFDYRIKPEPKTRLMTRGEVLYMVTTTPAMVVRFVGDERSDLAASRFDFTRYIGCYEYAIIDKHGKPVDGWHKFEVEE